MTLTTDEKALLRKAICDGAFSETPQQGRPVTITAEHLAAVAAMSDADVRVVLRAYQVNKAAALQTAINRTQARVTQAQTEMTFIQEVVII